MDSLIRTVAKVLKSSLDTRLPTHSRVFSYVRYVTGKASNTSEDYKAHYNSYLDALTLQGKEGFVVLQLTPLFEVI